VILVVVVEIVFVHICDLVADYICFIAFKRSVKMVFSPDVNFKEIQVQVEIDLVKPSKLSAVNFFLGGG